MAVESASIGTAAARQGHGLVDHRHALGHPAGLHVGQPTVGQGLGLEVDVAEAAGPVESQLGPLEEQCRVVDVATHGGHRHPPLLDARLVMLDQPHGAA